MATLPSTGDTNWGTTLNAVITEEHNSDGTHSDITTDNITASGDITATGKITVGTFLSLPTVSELTISDGAVTATQSYHSIDTENDDASDDLYTINGGTAPDILIIRPASSDRTIVVKDSTNGTGNLRLAGDFTMDSERDHLMLIKFGGDWIELSRSNVDT